ncbi:MAG TPA: hypothetical protein VII95_08410 [Terriglobales bacterium]|jgi:hypothetical protein
MDCRVRVPYIEVRIEGPKQLRIVTDRSFNYGRLSRFGLRQLLHPMSNMADRLLHHADVTVIEGDSYRVRESEQEAAARRRKK